MRPFEPAGGTVKVTAGTAGTDRVALSVLPNVAKRRLRITNAGAVTAFINFGFDVSVVASLAAGHPILPNSFQDIVIGQNETHMAAIVASTTADVYVTEGY